MTTTTTRWPRERHADAVAPDKGCQYAPRCTACPWSVCVKELPNGERNDFIAALKIVTRYVATPDRTLR